MLASTAGPPAVISDADMVKALQVLELLLLLPLAPVLLHMPLLLLLLPILLLLPPLLRNLIVDF